MTLLQFPFLTQSHSGSGDSAAIGLGSLLFPLPPPPSPHTRTHTGIPVPVSTLLETTLHEQLQQMTVNCFIYGGNGRVEVSCKIIRCPWQPEGSFILNRRFVVIQTAGKVMAGAPFTNHSGLRRRNRYVCVSLSLSSSSLQL